MAFCICEGRIFRSCALILQSKFQMFLKVAKKKSQRSVIIESCIIREDLVILMLLSRCKLFAFIVVENGV